MPFGLPNNCDRATRASLRTAIGCVALVIVGGCSGVATERAPAPPVLTSLSIAPKAPSIEAGATQQFTTSGRWSDGSSNVPAVGYSATGGTISSTGAFVAGTTPGTFHVIARQLDGSKTDTASVRIEALPEVVSIEISPQNATMSPTTVRQFTAVTTLSNGATSASLVSYSAAGGTISSTGLFRAGTVPGVFRIIATNIASGRADSAYATITGLWAADMETGNLIQWEANIYQSAPCGGQFNSGAAASTVASTDVAHTGLWSAKMTIGSDTIGTENGTRMFRWCEPQRNRELYYSAWYYLPVRFDVRSNGWTNVFQFKSERLDKRSIDPFFFLGVQNAPNQSMRFLLTWWDGLTIAGPFPGQSGFRTWTSPASIPVATWFNVETRYVCASDFTGAIQVWQNGVEIFRLEGVRTSYSNGDCQWSVNNYGTRIQPSPVILYVDDAVISRTRIVP